MSTTTIVRLGLVEAAYFAILSLGSQFRACPRVKVAAAAPTFYRVGRAGATCVISVVSKCDTPCYALGPGGGRREERK